MRMVRLVRANTVVVVAVAVARTVLIVMVDHQGLREAITLIRHHPIFRLTTNRRRIFRLDHRRIDQHQCQRVIHLKLASTSRCRV